MANEPHFSAQSMPSATEDASALVLRPQVTVAGKYRLLRPAGFGGMGAVWVAQNEMTSAEVALKVLLANDSSSEANTRFRREAYAAAKLSHRGIVRVFDLVELTGPHAGTLVMVMELLRGETLADRFDQQERFEVDEALGIVVPLLSALAHAHGAGIIHRDLKPENIFLSIDPDGHVTPKILDFGISKLTAPGVPAITGDGDLLGTPSYMSPEQARGSAHVDARSDVFTMGILIYEMISGENPFTNASYHSVVAAILERDPEPLRNVSPALWEVIRRALSKSPDDRYADARGLSEALCSVGGAPAATSSSYPPPPLPSSAPPEGALRVREDTVRNVYGIQIRRRRRNLKVVFGVFGAASILGLAALVVGRVHVLEEGRAPSAPSAAMTVTARTRATVPDEPPKARPPEVNVDALPLVPASSTASAAPVLPRRPPVRAAAPAASPALPGTGAPLSRVFPAAPDTAAPVSAPVAAPPRNPPSGVVRDPGF